MTKYRYPINRFIWNIQLAIYGYFKSSTDISSRQANPTAPHSSIPNLSITPSQSS